MANGNNGTVKRVATVLGLVLAIIAIVGSIFGAAKVYADQRTLDRSQTIYIEQNSKRLDAIEAMMKKYEEDQRQEIHILETIRDTILGRNGTDGG